MEEKRLRLNDLAANALANFDVQQQMVKAKKRLYANGLNIYGVYNETGFRTDYYDGAYHPFDIQDGTAAGGIQKISIPLGSHTVNTVHIHPTTYYDPELKRIQHSGYGPSQEDMDYVRRGKNYPYIPGIIIDENRHMIFIHDEYGNRQNYPGFYELIFGY